MSLIDVTVPEGDGWQDNLAARILLLFLGAMIMRSGLRLWSAAFEVGLGASIVVVLSFALGTQIAILSAADIDLEAHGRTIGYVVTVALTLFTLALSWHSGILPRLGSDVIAFSSYAAELVVEGGNPFAQSMAPAAELPGHPDRWTLRQDGSRVVSWSYPGGTLWLYGAQFAAIGRGPIGIRLTSIVGVGLLSAVLVHILPSVYGPAAPLSLLMAQNEWLAAAGGLNDMFWVLPTCVALWLWASERRVLSAAALGAACAMKQQPWFIALFMAVWVIQESDSLRAFASDSSRYIGAGLSTFALLNLPWLLADPVAWVDAVLVPIAGGESPLVSTGVGIAALNSAADGAISRSTFELLIPVAVAGMVAVYWYWFDQIKWAAWLASPMVLFWAPRSLPSYFHWAVPIALLAVMARHGRLRGQRKEVAA